MSIKEELTKAAQQLELAESSMHEAYREMCESDGMLAGLFIKELQKATELKQTIMYLASMAK